MKASLVIEVGVIGEDGRLRLPHGRLEQFYAEHKGERAIVKVEALERHGSPAMFRYYFGYVIPTVREAFVKKGEYKRENEVHDLLWGEFPGYHCDDIRQAGMSQLIRYFDWLKQYCAENLDVYVEDPNYGQV